MPIMENADKYCFLNGQIVPLIEAKVSVLDIGLLRGYGIYDGIAAFSGQPFRFADHWERFVKGAHFLNLNIPITEDKCEKIIKELLEKNSLSKNGSRANVRIMLTGGPAVSGIEYSFETPTFYITTEEHTPLSADYYMNGAKLVTYPFQRQYPEIKTTNYITAVNLQNFKKEESAAEILFVNEGEVLECATSNIFIVKNGTLCTPAEDVLGGVTAKVICELLPVEKKVISEEELKIADEVFITSSFKDIVPIVKIDDFVVGNGEVGPVTKDLMERFAKLINV
jgi:branched-chain amino acid aminotransferase